LGEGLAALPMKKNLATETSTSNQNILALEEDDLPNRKIMTQSSESRKNREAARPTNILSTEDTTMFGTWNVRTMYEMDESAHVAT